MNAATLKQKEERKQAMSKKNQDKEVVTTHVCTEPGLVMNDVVVKKVTNMHGQTYWLAKATIHSIFGTPVQGGCQGIGNTKEIALERLKADRQRLHDSLWA